VAALDYVGPTPTHPNDLVPKSYLDGLTAQNIDQATVDALISAGFAPYATRAYVDQQDALLATKAYVDAGDAGLLHKAQINVNSGGAIVGMPGLDASGKVDPARVNVPSQQTYPAAYYSPAAYNGATVTASGNGETTVYTTTIPDQGHLYQITEIYGVVDVHTAHDGEPPVARVRLGSAGGQVLAIGAGSSDSDGNSTISLISCYEVMTVISGPVTLYLTLTGNAPDASVSASTLNPALWVSTSQAPAGSVPFMPFAEGNTARANQATPANIHGAFVTLVGGGGGGGTGPGSGGGGGSMIHRVWVPARLFGPSYSVGFGTGGAQNVNGTASTFSTGSVLLTAGGGTAGTQYTGPAAGGVPSATGVTPQMSHGGDGGGVPGSVQAGSVGQDNHDGGGAGGGSGARSTLFTGAPGGAGGNTAAPGGTAGADAGGAGSAGGNATNGGSGGGGGGGNGSGNGGAGGNGGAPGGGGGGGGGWSLLGSNGAGGRGGDGSTLVEFQ
jgi:hypothetical protein